LVKDTDNEINDHELIGVTTGFSYKTVISNNIISNQFDGIYVYQSIDTTISHNTITYSSEFGVLLRNECDESAIFEKSLSNNRFCIGIFFSINFTMRI